MNRLLILLISLFLFTQTLFGQSKKPLTHDVYDEWNTVSNRIISNDGKLVAYSLTPQEGDAVLYLHTLNNSKNLPKTFLRGENAKFTSDSRFLVFQIKVQLDTLKKQRRNKVNEKNLPKDSLGVYDIQKDTLIKIPNIKSFQMPEKEGSFVAFLIEIRPFF